VPRFVLASQSPRRIDLLTEAGYAFEVVPAEVEEDFDPSLKPPQLTCANAALKASHVAAAHPEAVVLGADTLVYLDDQPLGKPAHLEEAFQMLTRLAGRTHQVCTGVALISRSSGLETTFHVITHVTFRALTAPQIDDYLNQIHPLDKAGAYAAQDHGSLIIDHFEGSWTNVVGLPMEETKQALGDQGIQPSSE
jgi:septum formation protein